MVSMTLRWTVLSGLFLFTGCGSEHDASGGDDSEESSDTLTNSDPIDSGLDGGTEYTTAPTGGSETCLWVRGGTDRVRASAVGTPVGQSPQTLEAWVRTISTGDQVAVSHGLASPGKGLYLGTSDGFVMASTAGLPYVDESFFVADGAWHHLALTFDGQAGTFTVDGMRGEPFELDDIALVEGEVVAGAAPTTGGMPWVGWLDDVKIFARERTIADLADPEAEDMRGLVLWWDFEVEGSGPGVEIPDLSGTGSDGISGGSEGTPSFLPCRG